jgi:glycosyltransferase involved in cell wall biosynthesis
MPPFKNSGQPLTVVYAGVGTETKGFHLLPEIIGKLSDLVERGEIAFRIQANILDRSADMVRAVTNLRKLKIELIEGPVEPAAYYDLLSNAGILLQPHDPSYYKIQSSGVFAEGRAAGMVAVVPAQTTMAQEISRAGGGIAVGGKTDGAYADALRYCVDRFDQLASEARDAAPAWRTLHSPGGFTKALNSILPPSHQLWRHSAHRNVSNYQ